MRNMNVVLMFFSIVQFVGWVEGGSFEDEWAIIEFINC